MYPQTLPQECVSIASNACLQAAYALAIRLRWSCNLTCAI